MRNWNPLSKTYWHKYPDGSVKLIYKNVNDAFPLYIPGWEGKAGVTLDAIAGAPVNITGEYATKIQGLLYSLDELNQSLMMTFRSSYTVYQTDPCANGGFFQRQVEKAIDEQNRQTSLKVQIRGLISLAELHPGNPEHFLPVFQDIIQNTGGPSVVLAASQEIEEARSIAQKWVES